MPSRLFFMLLSVVFAVVSSAAWSAESCSEQWRRHGHTNQTEAKRFARNCLRQQGAVPTTLSASMLATKLRGVVPSTHALAGLEPTDMSEFCPRYSTLSGAQRATVWQTMLARIVTQESNRDSGTPYWETSQNQFSIGLLQLSLSDEGRYHCGFNSEADLTDADRNLTCGAKIMDILIRRSNRIGGDANHIDSGAAAYWSTLRYVAPGSQRPDGSPARDSRSKVIADVKALSICRSN